MKYNAQGDFLLVEKIDYDEEQTTDSGIIFKTSQVLSTSFAQAKVISMGNGEPGFDGAVAKVDYKLGDIVLYDVTNRIGIHDQFDVLKREHIVAVVNEAE